MRGGIVPQAEFLEYDSGRIAGLRRCGAEAPRIQLKTLSSHSTTSGELQHLRWMVTALSEKEQWSFGKQREEGEERAITSKDPPS